MRLFLACLVVSLASMAVLPRAAHAIFLYKSATRNTAAPTGTWTDSGWQFEGKFSGFLGTAIAKQYFITAGHFNGSVNNPFEFQGTSFSPTLMWDDPNSDLRIYKVKGALPKWAQLYTNTDQVGKSAVMIGRGTQRGRGVIVDGVNHGWKWGAEDGVQSWGTNVVSGTADGGQTLGELLKLDFNAKGSEFEGALSRGDSGGGVFIKDGSKWKLAGVNFSADGPFSLTTNGTTFDASVFDRGGLWAQATGFVQDKDKNLPGASYATRISARTDWITGVLNGSIAPSASPGSQPSGRSVPEPTGAVVILGIGAWSLAQRRSLLR